MDEITVELVAGAIKREGFYEQVETRIHEGKQQVYFICHDLGVELGAYTIPFSELTKQNTAMLGFTVLYLVNHGDMLTMQQIEDDFALPLPFEEG